MKVMCHVRQQNPGEASYWKCYEVEMSEGPTVLDLLHEISKQDPGLAYATHHCKAGICGGCRLVIDGRQRFGCRTLVESSEIRLEPVIGFPLIKDLLVDFLVLPKGGATQRRKRS